MQMHVQPRLISSHTYIPLSECALAEFREERLLRNNAGVLVGSSVVCRYLVLLGATSCSQLVHTANVIS